MGESSINKISILYANRNREVNRIKASLDSLEKQTQQNFEVIFVDYGSDPILVDEYRNLFKSFNFVRFFSLEVPQLLWNKSKSLNYGIKKAANPIIFIADVDLIFHPNAVSYFDENMSTDKFFLFKLGYLNLIESKKLLRNYTFQSLQPRRFGHVNGMILVSKEALLKVNGLDEFFHFYGAEDEDLFARLENAGFKKELDNSEFFYHQWHHSFSGSEDQLLTGNPRVKNIMRINQRHYLRNRKRGILKPLKQERMGKIISKEEGILLKRPDLSIKVPNIQAYIEHFLWEELASFKGQIIKVEFFEDSYFRSLKYKIRKILGRQTQPYISIKEINDILLKEILFKYRDSNYSFKVETDLRRITFCIKL